MLQLRIGRPVALVRTTVVLVTSLCLLGACNDVPVETQCEGFTLQVDEVQTSREPIKLDFLWVVDDSTSMCQEQASLADSIGDFLVVLKTFLNVDIRSAVVTTDAITESKRGRFVRKAATEFPPLCQERRQFPARSDLHCECAACEGWDAAFKYQFCYDHQDAPDSCVPDAAAAPTYIECLANRGCVQYPAASQWIAEPPHDLAWLYNSNGSVNATCLRRCGGIDVPQSQAEADCQSEFGDPSMTCQAPGGAPNAAGCLKPPSTDMCPAEVPAPGVLPIFDETGAELLGMDSFACIATVGADQENKGANMEQGMKAAWLALSADGPYPTQICDPSDPIMSNPDVDDQTKRDECERLFLRQNAFLIIVFVTDEDDCSVAEGKTVVAEDYNQCALLGDLDTRPEDVRLHPGDINSNTDDRPLAPVYVYANRLKSLKSNPAAVFVAAIVGDAWDVDRELSSTEVDAAREAYYSSKTDRSNGQMRLSTYICSSAFGRADLGMRYMNLTAMFGPHGFAANICSNEGFGPALTEIASELVSEVISICLPRPALTVEGEEVLSVYKTGVDGVRLELEQGKDFIVGDEPEEGACPGSGRAIRFEKEALPLPDDTIRILYEAEANCGL